MLKIIIPFFSLLLALVNIRVTLENRGRINYVYLRIFMFNFKINIKNTFAKNKLKIEDINLFKEALGHIVVEKFLVTKYELYNENNIDYYTTLFILSNLLKKYVKRVDKESFESKLSETRHELDFKITLKGKIYIIGIYLIKMSYLKIKRRIYGRKNKWTIKSKS